MRMSLDFRTDTALAAILESLQEGVALYSADRTLLFINSNMRRLTGGKQKLGASLEGVGSRHRLYTENGIELQEHEFPIERAFSGEETHNEIFEYVAADGTRRWLLNNCITIRTEGGDLLYVLTTVHDVTNRKRREDKLRFMVESAKILAITQEFRERLVQKARLTVPSLADWCAIDLVRDDGEIERIVTIHRDPEMLAFAEDLPKRFPPRKDAPNGAYHIAKSGEPEFYPNLTAEMIEAGLAQAPESERAAAREALDYLQLRSIMSLPIMARGRVLGIMTLAYAESGRMYTDDDFQFFQEYCAHVGILLENARLFAEVERRDQAKDLFLASLSHELRNPLAPIKSSLELLKFEDLLPQVREEIDIIEHQFEHMAKLLGDLLDVSRFTQGKIRVTKRHVDLRKLIERALKSTDSLLRTADITLHFTYPSMPVVTDADETRLEQAIVNLMSNAAKFTPAGGSIWVDIEKEGAHARITVRDNGSGIAAEDLPNIFNMYYQGRRETISNAGLGIGLLLVEQIVKLHGGSISAQSDGPGTGSQFTITLPLVPAATAPESDAKRPGNALMRRILVVDDNAQAADSLVKLLNKLGARADAAYSGEETLERENLHEYEVMLLDVGMPRIDGYELVRMLRERGIERPIIALTGYGMSDDKTRALEAGFSAHLTKPVGLSDIVSAFEGLA